MTSASGRLVGELVRRRALGDERREAMWRLFASIYAGTPREVFERDLDAKRSVILLFDSGDGSLQGFSTVAVEETPGGPVVLFSGDTVIAKAYWGQKVLQRLFVRCMIEVKLRYPLRTVYWFLVSKGYRTYLLLSRNFPWHYPRHDRPTPPEVCALIGALARARFPERYDAARGVLCASDTGGHVREGVAPLEGELCAAADVRFFVEHNPGYERGEELCCVGRVDATVFAGYVRKLLGRRLRRS